MMFGWRHYNRGTQELAKGDPHRTKPLRQMLGRFGIIGFAILNLAFVFAFMPSAYSQISATPVAQPMIAARVDESVRAALSGNTRPEAKKTANDRGIVPDTMPMAHMMLQLRRPAAQEQALRTLIEQLNDPQSPNFHHWLSAAQFGAQFGPADSDIATITGWLRQNGFTVNAVHPNKMVVDYSGTAGQVRAAFRTEIHNIDVNGIAHIANMSDPEIPAALAPAVVGVIGLHNIRPKPLMQPVKRQYSPSGYFCGPGYAFSCELVTPPDLATIYNFNPLFNAGLSGQGQTIYLIEDTDLYTDADWTTFRSTFGLSGYTGGSLSTIHPAPPSGPNNCTDPGVNDADGEAILDAEYASAAAPSAAIVMATCAYSSGGDGLLIAIQNLVNGANPPAIISMSYGECETFNGAASNSAYNSIYQQGAAEGTSIYVSSGDGGAAGCDNHDYAEAAQYGIAANGLGSSIYNVSVGGTDFGDSYAGTNGTYWSATNTSTYGSAKSYIPEIPWNNSCGSQLYATHYGFATTYGSSGLCNSSTASDDNLLDIGGGSGAPSSCATGSGNSCAGWPKPNWQNGILGNPADGVRDLPDISLFAAAGAWGHFYLFCYSDIDNGGASCTGAPIHWSGAGGTSFASPIWAGIQALINQQSGGAQGVPNSRLYALAAAEYGANGSNPCNASNGNSVDNSCIFYNVTLGDNDVPCYAGYPNCYAPSGYLGVLSTSTTSYQPAYPAQPGWSFATGLGTVNVANLVTNWQGGTASSGASTTTGLTSALDPSTYGQSVTFTATVVSSGGTPTGTVTFKHGSTPFGTSLLLGGTATYSTSALLAGSRSITASYSGNSSFASSVSGAVTQTVYKAATTTIVSASPDPSAASHSVTFTATVSSGAGTPTGTVTFSDGASMLATVSLSGGTATYSIASLSTGSHTITASYSGDSNFAVSASAMDTQTVDSSTPPPGTANRAWVSGHGTDAAGCGAPTKPCRSLQYVHDNIIAAGGEIDVLDPSGYGAVTISKSLSIVNDGVGTAGVQATGGQNAVVINAGASDNVTLRGLDIDGLGTGAVGIWHVSGGSLTITNCAIRHFSTDGMDINPNTGTSNVSISGTTVSDNQYVGINVAPSGTASVTIAISQTKVNGSGGSGISIGNNGASAVAMIVDSVAFQNGGAGFAAFNSGTKLRLDRSVATGNTYGLYNSGAMVFTYSDNKISGNTTTDVFGALSSYATR
jgi:hypothetical protein